VDALKLAIMDNRFALLGGRSTPRRRTTTTRALAYTVRDRLLERFLRSTRRDKESRARTVCYFSAEYLLGPHTGNNLLNLGIWTTSPRRSPHWACGSPTSSSRKRSPGSAAGGSGASPPATWIRLRRSAFQRSLRYPLRVRHLRAADPGRLAGRGHRRLAAQWQSVELPRHKLRFPVKLGGHVEHATDEAGRLRAQWVPELTVYGKAYDTPILGFGVDNANLLRLWTSEARESFNFQAFNTGDYYGAVGEMWSPRTSPSALSQRRAAGRKELRLKQQYFFVSCSLQDMLRLHLRESHAIDGFERKFVAQLNDTHPAIAVAELMRLLVDEHLVPWEKAWDITRNTFAYTNHTLLPEALETWPEALFRRVLPRHLEIIFEINRRFLDEVRMRYLGDEERVRRMSLIDDANGRSVRMAHLACVGSFAVNGVARLHTELLKRTVLSDFAGMWPEKFSNKTNGVSPRRFVALGNPGLTRLLTGASAPSGCATSSACARSSRSLTTRRSTTTGGQRSARRRAASRRGSRSSRAWWPILRACSTSR